MLKKILLKNYRGFRALEVSPLQRVNLLTGRNDTGKTSVLEAVALLAMNDHLSLHQLPRLFRTSPGAESQNTGADESLGFWSSLFLERKPANTITIELTRHDAPPLMLSLGKGLQSDGSPDDITARRQCNGTVDRYARIRLGGSVEFQAVNQNAPRVAAISVQPTDPTAVAEIYNQASLQRGGERKIERLMKVMEPRIERLRYSKLPGTKYPLVYCDVGLDQALPATQMGQGFTRVLHIYSQVLVSRSEILLVDEIENGIHHTALLDFWRGLFEIAVTENVQILATTHSQECVANAHAAANASNADSGLGLFRLDRVDNEIKCTTIPPESLEVALQHKWEMR